MRNPFNDKFYDEKPYLTPEKCNLPKHEPLKRYIAEHKVKACVFTYCRTLKNVLDTISNNVVEVDFSQMGEDSHPIYAIDDVLFVVPYVGGPCACGSMEEIAVFGVKNFIACGSAGLIDEDFDVSKLFLVTSAIRDEGTSYHYAPPEVKATTSKELTETIERVFREKNVSYGKGVTWTTDAFYREVPSLIKKRLSENAVAVEMECSAWCICAKYLGVNFGQFLFFSDAVSNQDWTQNGDTAHRLNIKEEITLLAYEVAKRIK